MRKSPFNYISDIEWDKAACRLIDDYYAKNGVEPDEPGEQEIFEAVHFFREIDKEDSRFADDFDRGMKGLDRDYEYEDRK